MCAAVKEKTYVIAGRCCIVQKNNSTESDGKLLHICAMVHVILDQWWARSVQLVQWTHVVQDMVALKVSRARAVEVQPHIRQVLWKGALAGTLGRTLFEKRSLQTGIARWRRGCKRLPKWFGTLLCPRPMSKWEISWFRGDRTLARMVCALSWIQLKLSMLLIVLKMPQEQRLPPPCKANKCFVGRMSTCGGFSKWSLEKVVSGPCLLDTLETFERAASFNIDWRWLNNCQ